MSAKRGFYVSLLLTVALSRMAAANINFQYPRATATPNIAAANLVTGDFNNDGKLDLATDDDATTLQVFLGDGKGGFTPLPAITSSGVTGPLAAADFNNDGHLDLAFAGVFNGYLKIAVLLGNGDGTFQKPLLSPGYLLSFVVGDFNGDGILDIAASERLPLGTLILIGRGDGTFERSSIINLNGQIVTADFNLDGKLDLAGPNQVFLGNGDGTFQRGTSYANFRQDIVATGDFNGDGIPDLATAVFQGRGVLLHLGNGNGTFLTQTFYPSNLNVEALAVGDINSDGRSDLFVVTLGVGVSVMTGTSDGDLTPAITSFIPNVFAAVALGDFNGDGKLDVVGSNPGVTLPSSILYTLIGNGTGKFDTPQVFAFPSTVDHFVTADFNHDGLPDLAVSSLASRGVFVLLGKRDGFTSATLYPGKGGSSLAVGDLNNDGTPDLISASIYSDEFSVLLGDPDGTFQASMDQRVQPTTFQLLLADLNGDGNLDLISDEGPVYVSFGNGDGTFQPHTQLAVLGYGIATADFNRDGISDLAVSVRDGITTFLGNGDGTFQTGEKMSGGAKAPWLTVADLNSDGKPDLMATSPYGVTVFLGSGDGTFLPSMQYATGFNTYQAQAADFDGDGKVDIAVSSQRYTLGVFPGNGDGTFQSLIPFPVIVESLNLAIADFTGDGKPDVAALGFADVIVIKNASR